MSYILDALKKMEQEKNMKAAPKERINLSGAMLKDDLRPQKKPKASKLAGIIVIALIAASGSAWYFFGDSSKAFAPRAAVTTMPQQNQVMPPAAQPQPVPPAPVVPSPSPASGPVTANSAVAPPSAVPEQEDEDERRRIQRSLRANRKAKPSTQSAQSASPVAPVVNATAPPAQVVQTPTPLPPAAKAPTPQVVQMKNPAPPVVSTIAAPANIKVSGIAWQDERTARRAVVNDMLMKEGNLVSGAKITEIKPDRVKFSISGSIFEVPLLSSAVAAPGAGK